MQPKHTARIATALGIVGLTWWWLSRGHHGLEVGDIVTHVVVNGACASDEQFVVVKTALLVPLVNGNRKSQTAYVRVRQLTGAKAGALSWRFRANIRKVRRG
jgi:hypothetical protein